MPIPRITPEQLKALLAPGLSIAGTIAAITPTKVDDAAVLAMAKAIENPLILGLLVNLINRLAPSLDQSGQLPPEAVAQLEAAIAALPA